MNGLYRLIELFRGPQLVLSLLWLGLVVVTCALLAMAATRWGQSRPLRKCVVLSLVTHLLLATYATTVRIVASAPGRNEEPSLRITSVSEATDPSDGHRKSGGDDRPWERFSLEAADLPLIGLQRADSTDAVEPERFAAADPDSLAAQSPPAGLPDGRVSDPQPGRIQSTDQRDEPLAAFTAEPIEAPQAARQQPVNPAREAPALERPRSAVAPLPQRSDSVTSAELPSELVDPSQPLQLSQPPTSPDPQRLLSGFEDFSGRVGDPLAGENAAGTPPGAAPADSRFPQDAGGTAAAGELTESGLEAPGAAQTAPRQPSELYELRRTPGRVELAEQRGGSQATEAAVTSALAWLALNQEPDGRWDASRFGAGQGHDAPHAHRNGAGAQADTGVTALALLAFLGAGHTHLEGDHRRTVARGLDYLLASQAADGNLGGNAELYAFMYCHGMGAFALSEAYGMTLDERLLDPVRRAVAYTLRAQHPTTGGWRYRPSDPGDTSQLGWQLMALKSAELAGIAIPQRSKDGMVRFLESVASGRRGGLASYRPGEQPSRPMTAEALVCRLFLGMARANPAADEAGDSLLDDLPGHGPANLYYWYYATLGMFQLQGEHWTRWNEAVSTELVGSQRADGALAGSWDPDPVWGGHGGRVYSTAMGALCLEVYYRFLPLYVEAASRGGDLRK